MLTDRDKMHVDFCAEHNNGYCIYKHRICDGICNNCGLDAEPEKHATCNGSSPVEYVPHTAFYMDYPI